MKHRSLRVSKLIREELAKIILREFEFPGALVTITEVEVADKLESAKVLVSVIPSKSAVGVMRKLGASAGELQHLLLKKVNIKPMPRIVFELDHGPENAAVVEKKLLGE
ncbi:MAG TPA: ribosome-binding factor A [Candidatus Paceibacterota bacterium]|nr:ribosome-binding factor A [Candidatus Paceibacterota bacterium]